MQVFLSKTKISIQLFIVGFIAVFGLIAVMIVSLVSSYEQARLNSDARLSAAIAFETSQFGNTLLQLRRHEKDFLLRADTKFAGLHDDAIQLALAQLAKLQAIAPDSGDPELSRRLAAVSDPLGKYSAAFKRLTSARIAMGLTPDTGLEGQLRATIHDLEAKIDKLGDFELKTYLLTLRRHEKDFMMRRDPALADLHTKVAMAMKAKVYERALPAETKVAFANSIDEYHDSFMRWVDAAATLATAHNELSATYADLEPIVSRASETAFALSQERTRQEEISSQFNIILTTAFALLTLTLSLAVSILIWRFMTRALKQLELAMLRIARGDLETPIEGLAYVNEIGDMARALSVFRDSLADNERLRAATRTLSELGEWLQSAKSEAELYDMLADVLGRLMPECAGSLYIYSNSRDALELVKDWNGTQPSLSMHPDGCWALRKGHTYVHGSKEIEFRCDHVQGDCSEDYCCIPILAHGDIVGLMHFEYLTASGETRAESRARFADRQRLGQACAEHVSMAIANVKLRDDLRDQSTRDILTGLFNRRYLFEAGRRELKRADRAGKPMSVIAVDIDHFKIFNDTCGHDAGDIVLRNVAQALSQAAGGDAIVCRYGGEEFILLMPDIGIEAAAERAESLRAEIEALVVSYAETNLPQVTISAGVAAYPDAGSTLMELIKAADDALYAAKRDGRNRVERADSPSVAAETEADAAFGAAEAAETGLDRMDFRQTA